MTLPKYPRGWCPRFILILCEDRYGYHPQHLVIKAMMYGWCTNQYWVDYPSSEQIREAVETHPDFNLDDTEYFAVGDCLYCRDKHAGQNNFRFKSPQ